jgi:hypothetical protein
MTGDLVVERAADYVTDDAHVALILRPVLDDDAAAAEAVAVAGILARIAVHIAYPLRVQQAEHRCRHGVRRYNDDLGELVEGEQYEGCRVLVAADGPEVSHLLEHGPPFLILHIPRNRERAWRTRLDYALDVVTRTNDLTLNTAPPVVDDDTAE